MIVRALDEDGDWTFGSGKSNYLSANAAVGQSIATRLRSFLGDCFFDVAAGIDWFNLLGTKNVRGVILSAKSTIINTQDVTKLIDLNQSLEEARDQSLSYTVATVYSEDEPITGTVGVP